MTRRTWVGWLGVLALCAGGCGGKSVTYNDSVEGTVKMDGTPLVGVVVEFVPDGTERLPQSTGYTDEQGHFTLQCDNKKAGAVIGKHHVVIHPGRGGARPDEIQAA